MSGSPASAWRANGRAITAFVAIAASAFLLAACGNGSAAPQSGEDTGSGDIGEAVEGTWGSTAERQPHLVFADGKVTGSDGCNGISTTYSVDGEAVTVEPFMSTLKACMGVDTWLRGVHTVTIDGDALLVLDAAGETIGTLDRN